MIAASANTGTGEWALTTSMPLRLSRRRTVSGQRGLIGVFDNVNQEPSRTTVSPSTSSTTVVRPAWLLVITIASMSSEAATAPATLRA